MDHSRIIRGAVGGGRYTVTAPITQWDYGYLFLPEIDDLPATYRLDFSNDEHHGTALSVYCGADGGEVPEELIDTGKDIFVWYFYIGDGYGKTEYKWRIPNKCKPKGDGETPEPSQQSSIDQLIYVANEAIDTAHESASQASASAQSASESAEQAQESARTAGLYSDTAQTYANSAEISANSASASAEASAQSASQSAQIKADVEDLADDAQGYANASAQSATASANSASQASGYAQSASASAQSASGYASQAQTSAQTASAKAQEASGYASTASTQASEALSSALSASGYATQAESAKTASQTAQGLAESARDDAIDAKTDAESARDEAQSIVDGISGKVEQIDQNTADIASLEEDIYKPYAVDTASGAIASFPDGADGIPLKSLVVNIDPVQDLSQGDPSPENICPISGWTEVGVEQSGVNVWDEEWEVGGIEPSNGRNNEHTNRLRSKNYIPCRPSATYWFKKADDAQSYRTVYYDKEQTFIESSNSMSASAEFTTPDNCYFVRFFSMNPVYSGDISINYPSTDHDYHPYTGRSITIDLGQTVYGGKLDVLSGKLYVGYGICKVKDLSWSLYNTAFYATKNDVLHGVAKVDVRCDRYRTAPSANGLGSASGWPDKIILGNIASSSVIYIKDTTYASVSEFKTAQGEMDIVYPLATPIEIQLDAHTINSLYGQNNIFADTGDCEVEYRADTKLYIERLTAPDSADMIADANITSGQYFMVGNSLFKATANIANGGQITVGTNCTRVSLAQALNEINA